MSDYRLTIRGQDVEIQLGSLSIDAATNGPSTLRATVQSLSGAFRVQLDDPVELTQDSVVVYGGLVDSYREQALSGWGADIQATITCRDYSALAARRYLTEAFSEGTLKSVLTIIVDDYLSDYGITLDGSQVDGPTVPAIEYSRVQVSEVLRDLATRTGYVWQIDAIKVLRMQAPSAVAAPFDVSSDETHVVGDVVVEERREDMFANRAIVVVSGTGADTVTDTFVAADGVSSGGFTRFTTSYPIRELVSTVLRIDDVLQDQAIAVGVGNLIANGGTYAYAVDLDAHQLVYDEASGATYPTGTEQIGLDYRIAVPFEAIYQDDTDVGARGPWEVVVPREEALTVEAAEALAAAEVARRMQRRRKITYNTHDSGLLTGQQQHVNEPYRDIDVDGVVNEIRSRMIQTDLMAHDVVVSEGSFQDTYRDVYRQWFGSDVSSRGSISGGGSSALPALIFMGGSRNTAIAPPANTWVDAVNYIDYVPQANYNTVMRVELWGRQSGVTVRARLRNITGGETIGEVSTTATTPSTLTFGAALTAGRLYRLQVSSDTDAAGIYAIATM